MNETHEQRCPLCDTQAVYYGVDANNLKYFNCTSCTYYLISWRAEERVIVAPFEKKQSLARMAQLAPEGQVLLISVPPPSQDPEVPREPFSASWVAKSGFRL